MAISNSLSWPLLLTLMLAEPAFSAEAGSDSATVGDLPAVGDTAAMGEPRTTGESGDPGPYAVVDSEKGPFLVGEVNRGILNGQFPSWQQEYDSYEPDTATVGLLQAVQDSVLITCVLGTWCSDSEREVPRFWKILDLAGNPNLTLTLLAVARRADQEFEAEFLDTFGLEPPRSRFDIQLVPTFLFFAAGTELGRIVESPELSLEADAAVILNDLIAPAPDQVRWH